MVPEPYNYRESGFRMALRFRKRVRIAPGISINITQKGITSATVGPRGANVNVGKKGAYLNAGLPGTGIYSRTQIAAAKKAAPQPRQAAIMADHSPDSEAPAKKEPGLKEGLISIGLIVFVILIAIYLL